MGTEGTDNMVADEMGDGQYEHVSVVKKVAKATFSSLEALDAAACSGASGDLIDGVVVAVDAITKFVRNLKFGKRLVLVTDGHAFMGIDDGDVDPRNPVRHEPIREKVCASSVRGHDTAYSRCTAGMALALGGGKDPHRSFPQCGG